MGCGFRTRGESLERDGNVYWGEILVGNSDMVPVTRVRAGARKARSKLVNFHRWVERLRTALQDKGASEGRGGVEGKHLYAK